MMLYLLGFQCAIVSTRWKSINIGDTIKKGLLKKERNDSMYPKGTFQDTIYPSVGQIISADMLLEKKTTERMKYALQQTEKGYHIAVYFL